ncbi:hypothetical protein WJX74_008890 [Apatococcus lobatus]|uniref:Uncharacterized protein n=1 Tax=Apatococcus lobatus TaxID=904363 RepID=A0AAW1QID4_9CHLO
MASGAKPRCSHQHSTHLLYRALPRLLAAMNHLASLIVDHLHKIVDRIFDNRGTIEEITKAMELGSNVNLAEVFMACQHELDVHYREFRSYPASVASGSDIEAHPHWIGACFSESNGIPLYLGLRRTELFKIGRDGTPSAVFAYEQSIVDIHLLQQQKQHMLGSPAKGPAFSRKKAKRTTPCREHMASARSRKRQRRQRVTDETEEAHRQQPQKDDAHGYACPESHPETRSSKRHQRQAPTLASQPSQQQQKPPLPIHSALTFHEHCLQQQQYPEQLVAKGQHKLDVSKAAGGSQDEIFTFHHGSSCCHRQLEQQPIPEGLDIIEVFEEAGGSQDEGSTFHSGCLHHRQLQHQWLQPRGLAGVHIIDLSEDEHNIPAWEHHHHQQQQQQEIIDLTRSV